jgi:hypothetical protein
MHYTSGMSQRDVVQVKPLEDYCLWIQFADGVEGIVDLSGMAGKGVFSQWKDYREFQKARVGSAGEVTWGDEIDLCPDALYLKVTGKKPEKLFPKLGELVA